jgi:hypothetical protein
VEEQYYYRVGGEWATECVKADEPRGLDEYLSSGEKMLEHESEAALRRPPSTRCAARASVDA